jgi:phage shock protein A
MPNHAEVNSARVSVVYWKKQAREALEAKDDDRFQKCCEKLSHWEEILSTKRAALGIVRIKRVKVKMSRAPVQRPRQLPAPPDAPTVKEWVPLPLTWD